MTNVPHTGIMQLSGNINVGKDIFYWTYNVLA
jgi:hypothetical protein